MKECRWSCPSSTAGGGSCCCARSNSPGTYWRQPGRQDPGCSEVDLPEHMCHFAAAGNGDSCEDSGMGAVEKGECI